MGKRRDARISLKATQPRPFLGHIAARIDDSGQLKDFLAVDWPPVPCRRRTAASSGRVEADKSIQILVAPNPEHGPFADGVPIRRLGLGSLSRFIRRVANSRRGRHAAMCDNRFDPTRPRASWQR